MCPPPLRSRGPIGAHCENYQGARTTVANRSPVKALLKDHRQVGVRSLPDPVLQSPDQVLIRVMIAGLCRTDLYAARGELEGPAQLILGHEFSGVIEALGSAVEALQVGQRVTVFPWQGCRSCPWCLAGKSSACSQRQMLGVHLHGGFAERVVVSQEMVYPLNPGLSFQAGAYVEPVAASLAVLKAGLNPQQRGMIYGENRIAELTYRVLKASGFTHLEKVSQPEDYAENSFDFVIETRASPEDVRHILRLLKPGGQWVIKTRHPRPLEVDLLTLIAKEPRLTPVNYAGFQESMALLQQPGLQLEGLLGPVHPLEEWPLLFEEAEKSEGSKRFLSLVDDDVWNS